jgi:hypothetical protein
LSETKTIQVKNETKQKLDDLGKKGETYDAIIWKLINVYAKHSPVSDQENVRVY